MLPEVSRKPCSAHHPHTAWRVVDASGDSPDVGVVVQNPAILAIHDLRRVGTCRADFTNQSEQRLVEVGEIRRLRWPVVHLEVDVRGVFRVP